MAREGLNRPESKNIYLLRKWREILPYFSSVQFNHSVMSNSLRPHGLQHARLSITNSWSLLKLMSIESVMPSNRLILCLSPPAFSLCQHHSLSQWVISSYQVAKVLELRLPVSVLQMNIQDWFPWGWTCWISLLSKRLSRVFSNTTVQKYQFCGSQLSL